jgi:O-antigen/teichoic acid export membrane protein
MKKGNTLGHAIGWSGIGRLGSAGLTVIRLYLLSRLLPPEDFGIIAIAQVVISFSQLFVDSGLSVGFLHHQRTDDNTFSTLVWWNFLMGLGLYGIILLAAPYLASWYTTPELRRVLYWLCLCLPIGALGSQYRIARQKELAFGTIARVDWLAQTANTFGAVYLAWAGWGVFALVAGHFLQAVIASAGFILTERDYRLRWRFRYALLKPYLRIGLFYTGGQLFNTITRDLDTLVVGALLGIENLGVYHLLKRLAARPLQLFNPILSQVYVPILARLQDQSVMLRRNFLAGLRLIAGVQIPLYSGLAIFASPVIQLFYGSTYAPYATVFTWLCGYFLVRALIRPFSDLVIAKGKTNWEFYWNVAYSLIGFGVIIFGAKQSLLTLVQYLCIYMLALLPMSYLLFIRPLAGVKLKRYSFLLLWPLIVAFVAVSVAYLVTLYINSDSTTIQLTIGTLLSIVGYWGIRALGEGLRWPLDLWQKAQQSPT